MHQMQLHARKAVLNPEVQGSVHPEETLVQNKKVLVVRKLQIQDMRSTRL